MALAHLPRTANAEAAYLARLGERVRGWRTGRGVTRKALMEMLVNEKFPAPRVN